MCKVLLISDANILIDVLDGGVIEQFFQLDFDYAVPDVLYHDEIKRQHPELIDYGLIIKELSEKAVDDALSLNTEHHKTGVSVIDCMALALARQEKCPLLTGDNALRQVSLGEGADVRGTIWIIGEMLEAELLTGNEAECAYRLMKENGSRLPWDETKAQVKKYIK